MTGKPIKNFKTLDQQGMMTINPFKYFMEDETLIEMTDAAIEYYLEDERVRKLQKIIIANQDKIQAKIKEYSEIGYAFEVRNLEGAIRNAQEPVERLTEWQALNLEWCYEIMELSTE